MVESPQGVAGAGIKAGTGVGLSVRGALGVNLFLVWLVPGSISWESSLGVSLYRPEWPPGLIAPWQVASGVSLYCAGGLRRSVCVPSSLPPPLGLVAGLPFCLWVRLVFCDLCVVCIPEEFAPACVWTSQCGWEGLRAEWGDLAGCEGKRGARELLPRRPEPGAPGP